MLSSTRDGDPDRLTAQLPPASLDATAPASRPLRRTVGLPRRGVTAWHASAAQRASGDRHYSTHVFTPADIGPVHLEFQVLTTYVSASSSSRPCFMAHSRHLSAERIPHRLPCS